MATTTSTNQGAREVYGAVGIDGTVLPAAASTAVVTSVASSATSVTLKAANTSRLGLSIYNNSTSTLYVKFGTTASATDFTIEMAPEDFYEAYVRYTGRIDGVWASANGAALVTELT